MRTVRSLPKCQTRNITMETQRYMHSGSSGSDQAKSECIEVTTTRNHAKELDPPTFDAARTKRLLRKMDFKLIPFLSLLYLLSFLDRTNIGNARIFGMEKDLHMRGLDYNTALAVFFPTYVLAEVPSNMMLKRFGARTWITIIMIAWAAVEIGMGFVKNYKSLLATRAILGFCEGGLFPGVAFYITLWYPRHECAFRLALFFSAATAAGAFGGFLATAISHMEGDAGLAAWSWIFIIEGVITMVIAFSTYWLLVDSPDSAKFLNEEEKLEIKRRLNFDTDSLADEFAMQYFWDALKDWKIWMFMLIAIGIVTPVYSFSMFLPTIIKNMGYTTVHAQLLSVPPYVLGCIVTVCYGYIGDRHKQRAIFILGSTAVAIVGWVMLISTTTPGVQYTGTFLACSGMFASVPLNIMWNANNIGGSLKRGVGIAMQVGAGNLGGILASYIYLPKDKPAYHQGHGILIGVIAMSWVLIFFMRWWYKKENARRDQWAAENNLFPGSYTQEQKRKERTMGDNATFFRYTL